MPDRHYVGTELTIFEQADCWKSYVASAIAEYLRGHVAEVGAGLGGFTRFLLTAQVNSLSCIEPDTELLDTLRGKLASSIESGRVRCIAGTLEDVSEPTRFDSILYVDVLEHIADDRAELARAAARLAPSGSLIVLSPAHEFLYSDFDRAIGHYRRYNVRSLSSIVPAGLRCQSIRYMDSIGLLASLANRWLLRQAQPSHHQIQLWDKQMVPISRRVDPWLGHRVGKSVLAIYSAAEP